MCIQYYAYRHCCCRRVRVSLVIIFEFDLLEWVQGWAYYFSREGEDKRTEKTMQIYLFLCASRRRRDQHGSHALNLDIDKESQTITISSVSCEKYGLCGQMQMVLGYRPLASHALLSRQLLLQFPFLKPLSLHEHDFRAPEPTSRHNHPHVIASVCASGRWIEK